MQECATVCNDVQWYAMDCDELKWCAIGCNGEQWSAMAIVCNGAPKRAIGNTDLLWNHRRAMVSNACARVCNVVQRCSAMTCNGVGWYAMVCNNVQWRAMECNDAQKCANVWNGVQCRAKVCNDVQWRAMVCNGMVCSGVQ